MKSENRVFVLPSPQRSILAGGETEYNRFNSAGLCAETALNGVDKSTVDKMEQLKEFNQSPYFLYDVLGQVET